MRVPHIQTNCEMLAERLGRDILRRNLKPGDRYITTQEAAVQLGVSRMSADRAMNVLVKRKALVRQRGRGTFIGSSMKTASSTNVVHVHFLMFTQGESNTIWKLQPSILSGLRCVMPSAILHTHFLSFTDGYRHAKQIVENEPSMNQSGWILAASPFEVQRWFAQKSIPAIVFGEAYPGISLSDMKADQMESGVKLLNLANHLGAKRFVYINTQNWRQGDMAALNGALQELGNLKITADRLEVCSIPNNTDETKQILCELISRCTTSENNEKQGLLCRSRHFVELLLKIAEEVGVSVPDDLIVVYNRFWTDEGSILVPCVDEMVTVEEGFKMMATLIDKIFSPNDQEISTVRIPTKLAAPERYGSLREIVF